MQYAELFHSLHPDFFRQDFIRSLPPEDVFSELILDLHAFVPDPLPAPDGITFGLYEGSLEALHEAVRLVDEDWVQYFGSGSSVFCAMAGEQLVSFCILDDMGTHQGRRISGPGCVGTIPAFRQRGVGLKLVQLATEHLKRQGYDLSWIHYTHLAPWYSRLGYETVVRWNSTGLLWTKG